MTRGASNAFKGRDSLDLVPLNRCTGTAAARKLLPVSVYSHPRRGLILNSLEDAVRKGSSKTLSSFVNGFARGLTGVLIPLLQFLCREKSDGNFSKTMKGLREFSFRPDRDDKLKVKPSDKGPHVVVDPAPTPVVSRAKTNRKEKTTHPSTSASSIPPGPKLCDRAHELVTPQSERVSAPAQQSPGEEAPPVIVSILPESGDGAVDSVGGPVGESLGGAVDSVGGPVGESVGGAVFKSLWVAVDSVGRAVGESVWGGANAT